MFIKLENIPANATKQELRRLLKHYGQVTAVIKRGSTALIHMASSRRAQIAAQDLDSIKWKGHYIGAHITKRDPRSTTCHTSLGFMRMF
jgi:RNA recognition motif-containing protein